MVFPSSEDEHNPDPPSTQQHEEQGGKRFVCGSALFVGPLSFHLFFVVGVGESEVSKVCAKESFRLLGG